MTDQNGDNEIARGPDHELGRTANELDRRAGESPVNNVGAWLLMVAGVALLVILWGNFRNADAAGSVAASGLRGINVTAGSTRVEFEQGGSGDVDVALTGRGGNRQLEVNRDGNVLDVHVRGTWWLPGWFGFGRSVLTITIPAGVEPAVDVRTGSGRMVLENLSLSDVTVRSSSGRVCLQDLVVSGNLQVNTSSGAVCLKDSQVRGSASIQVSSGRVEVEDTTAAEFNFTSSSGRIEASGLPGTPVTASSSSGRVELAAESILDDWNVQSSSGRVTVSLGQVPANLGIDFRGSSGGWSVSDRYGIDPGGEGRNRLQATIGNGRPQLQVRTSSGGFSLD